MEIIMISNSKLKVMLCENDLKHFELNAEQLDYSNTETKRMFWDILSQAKHQTGFDTDGQRVLVQLYPSKEGGCEMFVTKIGEMTNERESKTKHRTPIHDKCSSFMINPKRNSSNNECLCTIAFENTKNLIEVCRRLDCIGYLGVSSAYSCDNGKKYLSLSDVDLTADTELDEFSFILEYGSPENSKNIEYYILEHGNIICKNDAVSVLANL